MKNPKIILFTLLFFLIYSCIKNTDQVMVEAGDMSGSQLPLIFTPYYDITLYGVEKLHSFDGSKYGKIFQYLILKLGLGRDRFVTPPPVTREELLLVHSPQYLDSLQKPEVIARIAELDLLASIPAGILDEKILGPMRYGAGGTILGLELALTQGWAINLSGGYHHAKADSGGGFCFYADIPVAVYKLRKNRPGLKVLVVDLDVHQGNGYAAIFQDDPGVFIFDIYNADIYPGDFGAKQYIDYNFPVSSGMEDQAYLALLAGELPGVIAEVKPDVIIYNAGTDIYKDDPLGRLKISEAGIIKRDELVFTYARENHVPILMLLSGGYSGQSADIIAHSIENLLIKVLKVEL